MAVSSPAITDQEALARAAAAAGGSPVHSASLTRAAEAIFVATDAGLVQIGGAAGVHGLSNPIHRDDAARQYLYPFGPGDYANLEAFAERIDRAFLPRPQRAAAAIAAGNRHPEISLPAVFEAFHGIFDETGRNLASTVQLSATREMTTDEELHARDGSNPTAPGHTRVSIRHLYHAGLWAAIRAGYRLGYNAEADHFIVSGADDAAIAKSVEWVKQAIREASAYTKFTTDTSRVFDLRADARHAQPYSEPEIDELFERRFSAEERAWILSAFSRNFTAGSREYSFPPLVTKRMAVKFGQSLKLNEALYDAISQARRAAPFDFEPSLDEAETLTTPGELIFYMHWLRERGRPAQLVPPNLGFKKRQAYPETRAALAEYVKHKMWPSVEARVDRDFGGDPIRELTHRVENLAEVARLYDGTLSIHSGSGKQAQVLRAIGAATRGRLNYKISGELQLQLFDVLAEEPPQSPERKLFERMVAASERFAAAGAFGEESALAAKYHASHGAYLGDSARGRTDGNLFLVFWLGNMVGCRDEDGRFFKSSLDHLPAAIVQEARRRNAAYIRWLAAQLFEGVE